MTRLVLPVLALAGCSVLAVDPNEAVLVCRAVECPDEDDIDLAVVLFAARAPLDRTTTITVEWHAPGETFATWTDDAGEHHAIGLTPTPDMVQVSSWRLLAHELMHLSHFRASFDPDASHADPPGPWSAMDDETVDLVKDDYLVAFSD